jgi:nucleotide-binding universal stress UspA family protein
MEKIYVPITGSPEWKRALSKGISLAKRLDRTVSAVYVVDKDSINKLERYKVFVEEESREFMESLKSNGEKYLSYARKEGEKEGVEVDCELLEGDPFTELRDYIEQDVASEKLVCIAKKSGGDCMKDILSTVERKILLFGKQDTIVIGE